MLASPITNVGSIFGVFIAAALALGCGLDAEPVPGGAGGGAAGPVWLEGAKVFVSGHGVNNMDCRTGICRHNENTDMVTFAGAIWLIHRTAVSQVLGPNSALHIYKSTDGGKSFAETARIEAPADRDIRDPHFYVVGGRLFIKTLTRLPVTSERDSNVDTIAMGASSTDGVTWSPLAAIGPETWSYWRIKENAGTLYTAAYEDGDKAVALFTSKDRVSWAKGASVYDVSADTPLETELVFMPSGKLLALVRMDGTDDELFGQNGRLRTKVCWASPPYSSFSCPSEINGQRLDGPLAFFHGQRLFVVARKHLAPTMKKRTALFELTGDLDGGALAIKEWGELPSAGDTSYAGQATVDADHVVVSWYSGDIAEDQDWIAGILNLTDIWTGVIDFSKIP